MPGADKRNRRVKLLPTVHLFIIIYSFMYPPKSSYKVRRKRDMASEKLRIAIKGITRHQVILTSTKKLSVERPDVLMGGADRGAPSPGTDENLGTV
jgi:hypothetical protein